MIMVSFCWKMNVLPNNIFKKNPFHRRCYWNELSKLLYSFWATLYLKLYLHTTETLSYYIIKATVPLHRLTIPSEKRTRTFIGLFNSFFSWFTDVSRRWQTALAVLNFGHVQRLERPASDRDWRFSYVTLAVFCRFHRYSGGLLPVFRLLWLLGRRTARPPPATERTIRLWNANWMLIHVFQTFFQPFRSLLILKQTLLRRSMFRKLGCMKTLLILKQTFLRRI